MFETVKAFNSKSGSDFKNWIKRQHNNAMHLKGNWLDESFPSFIDFLLSKIKISPTDKAPVLCKAVKTTL